MKKLINHVRRILLLGAISTLGFSSMPAGAAVWETVDSGDSDIAGGANGDTIIQLPDGSILNTFFTRIDGSSARYNEWMTRWKANEPGASWATIDHWAMEGDLLRTHPRAAASYENPDGTIEVFIVGYAYVNDLVKSGKGKGQTTENYEVIRWVVRRGVLSPGSTTWIWETVQMFGNESGVVEERYDARDVAIDENGTVYVTGVSNDDWLTEVSYDGGDTWFESDRWRLDSAVSNQPRGIAIGLNGAVLAVGYATELQETRVGRGKNATIERISIPHWITRKLDPATQSWSVKDDYVGGGHSAARTVFLTHDGILLVGGNSKNDVGGDSYWTLRASDDDGENWSTIDQDILDPDRSFSPHSITEGADGTIYVGGPLDGNEGVSGAKIRSTQNLVNWDTEIIPFEWTILFHSVCLLATDPNEDAGPYLYASEAGSASDGALIRKPIPGNPVP